MTTEDPSSSSEAAPTARVFPAPGTTLRRVREERGISLEQASEATRISERYLKALEDDEPLDDLLNPAYGRLFLKNYAKYLGLDADQLAPPPREQPALEPPAVDVLRPAIRPPGRLLSRLLVAAAIAAVVFLALSRNYGQQQEDTRASTPPRRSLPSVGRPSSQPSAAPSLSPSPQVVNGIEGSLKVTARSWVSVTADGKNVVRQTLEPPRSVPLQADRDLDVILGNGGGVRLVLNGQTIETGGSGEVVHLSFVVEDGQVIQKKSGSASPSPSPTPR
ncbi:MAG TPA: helix-turn-helix domain-containing protein [Actinomycetota bacterium]